MNQNDLFIPDNTKIEERLILTETDVIIGSHSEIDYGIKTEGSINAGERVKIKGKIKAKDDVQIGLWGYVDGDLETQKNAYIGERSKIKGELLVGEDLEIGNDVEIEESFEANGYITIANPIPLYIYFLLLLSELIRRNETEEIEEALDNLFEEEENEEALVIPKEVNFSSEIKCPGKIFLGKKCRFVGNLRGEDITIGEETTLFGGIKSNRNVEIKKDAIVHGDIRANEEVLLEEDINVLGNINAKKVKIHEEAHVNEKIKADEVEIFPKEDIEKEEIFPDGEK